MGQMLQGVGDPFEHLPIARPAWRPRSAQARARKSRGVARTRLTFARQKEGGSDSGTFWPGRHIYGSVGLDIIRRAPPPGGFMSGIYYILSIIAIFLIIRWVIRNDRISPDSPTKGLLAMKDHKPSSDH